MNSIEWLIEQLEERGHIIPDHLEETAIEMHRAEHGKTWDKAIESHENRGHNIERSWCDFDEYYQETFGSKGSGDVELPQPKISNEEMKKEHPYLVKHKVFI
jgi:hypothetical protein